MSVILAPALLWSGGGRDRRMGLKLSKCGTVAEITRETLPQKEDGESDNSLPAIGGKLAG